MSSLWQALAEFHFLRPLWFGLLLPVPLLLWQLKRSQRAAGLWHKVIDAPLLNAMLNQESQQSPKQKKHWPSWPIWLAAWLIAAVAIAGPSFKKMPQPVSQNQQALIILLDMSASMAANDIKPSRATRAVQKITDILRARPDGLTALIAYSGDAHTVTPLTTDTRTISSLLPALSPFMMPSSGSRPDKAIQLARTLAANSGIQQADLLLITDGLVEKDAQRMADELRSGLNLKIIALGSAQGAPIPLPNGGFLRDGKNQVVVPKLELATIEKISRELNVPWRELSLTDSDWQSLLSSASQHNLQQEQGTQPAFDLWRDDGYWLIFLLLPLVLLLFRRGVLLSLPMAFILTLLLTTQAQPAQASPWLTDDQQAAKLYEQAPEQAAELFQHPAWKASAQYQAGQYEQAAKGFAALPQNAENSYNLGNALAQNGQLQEALEAYDKALAQQPDFPQAVHNRKIVEDLLKQQEEQQQDQNQQQDQQQEQNSDSPDSEQQNSDEQNSEQQNSDQQNSDNQDSEQQNAADSQEENNEDGEEQDLQQNEQQDLQQDSQQNSPEQSDLSREEQEAMEKWLQQVPDNPGNLLQRKFLYQYRQRQQDNFEQGDALW